jgi:hypothetical protein
MPNKRWQRRTRPGRPPDRRRWFLDAAQTTRPIFVINPNGMGERQLTHPDPGVIDDHPDWSLDGTKIRSSTASPPGAMRGR